jgi:hypothetical protein
MKKICRPVYLEPFFSHRKYSEMQHFNWLSLFVTALVPLVIGFVWYSKGVFGNAWMQAAGVTEESAKERICR